MGILKKVFKAIRFDDYKGGVRTRGIFGIPLVKKDNVLTLLIAGIPVLQRKKYTILLRGGGGKMILSFDFAGFRFLRLIDIRK
ncbi:hypothetical protein [Helicobacter sp. 'CLO3_human']|uniref:hypothetical protein n=1 Tax=Helicobacter sp. 'CLO3_human' TaxID=2020249 RepID=UPI001F4187C8|nr:hypothetical protein [Helicobacter sp. 'CLO3_human']